VVGSSFNPESRSALHGSTVGLVIGLIGLLGYALYGRAMSFAEELPVYTSKIQQTIEPISRDLPPIFSPGIMRLSPGLGFRTWSL